MYILLYSSSCPFLITAWSESVDVEKKGLSRLPDDVLERVVELPDDDLKKWPSFVTLSLASFLLSRAITYFCLIKIVGWYLGSIPRWPSWKSWTLLPLSGFCQNLSDHHCHCHSLRGLLYTDFKHNVSFKKAVSKLKDESKSILNKLGAKGLVFSFYPVLLLY